jgi:hypothetical protein
MDGWVGGWMEGWIARMARWMDGRWLDGRWLDEWVDG